MSIVTSKELELLQPSKPKLSMKFLHELIRGLQHENLEFALRINELERQLEEFHQIKGELASAISEQSTEEEPIVTDVFHAISVPRSERHPKPKRRFF